MYWSPGAGVYPVNFVRHLLPATSTRSSPSTRSPTRAASTTSQRARRTSATVRARRRPRRGARARGRRGGGRDRQRRRRVARREVDRGRRGGVRDDERRWHADPARRDPRAARRALHPRSSSEVYGTALTSRWTRSIRSTRAARTPRRNAAPIGSPTRTRHVRPADRDRAAVQQLRAAAASGEGRAAVHHAGALRRAADDPTATATRAATGSTWTTTPRRSRRSSRPIDSVAGEVFNVATGIDISVTTSPTRARAAREARVGEDACAERPGQVDRHIGSTDKAERVLGWQARTSFEEGLERTVAGTATMSLVEGPGAADAAAAFSS